MFRLGLVLLSPGRNAAGRSCTGWPEVFTHLYALRRCGVRPRGGRQVHRTGILVGRSRLRRVADRTNRLVPAGVRERPPAGQPDGRGRDDGVMNAHRQTTCFRHPLTPLPLLLLLLLLLLLPSPSVPSPSARKMRSNALSRHNVLVTSALVDTLITMIFFFFLFFFDKNVHPLCVCVEFRNSKIYSLKRAVSFRTNR